MTAGMRVGILGGGQLAAMMAEAGMPMGLEFTVLDPAADACAGRYAELVVADWSDASHLAALLDCDFITCDFENVPADVLDALATVRPVRPGPAAFAAAQDRLVEKRLFTELDISVGPFVAVESRPDLLAAIEKLGLPAVLKTRRLGYDGKGQVVLRSMEDLEPAWAELGGKALILESWIEFRHECALTAVRSADGEIRFYPPSWTVHDQGILKLALAPAPISEQMEARARGMVDRLMTHLDYVGCLTLELFVTDDDLLANEFAPRPHNSAHWTIEGAVTSQFENHLRAVIGWPLGDTAMRGQALMLNWIGSVPAAEQLLTIPGLAWHDYAKKPRPGRKVGHATLIAGDRSELDQAVTRLEPLLDAQMAGLVRTGLPAPG